MSLTTCTIHFTKQSDKVIYISNSLWKTLEMPASKSVTVKFGSKSASASLKMVKARGNHIYLPELVNTVLKIPNSGKCLVLGNPVNEIRIGPVIGVMTNFNSSSSSPFGSRTDFIRQFMTAGASRAIIYAFRPIDVNWQQETVTTYFPKSEGGWVKKVVPLPDVVYNRLASRKEEKSLSMESFKDRFVRKHIPLFNWSFFDKWDVYNLLQGEEAAKHVPETYVDPTPEQIRNMLENHRFAYLKPTGGSLGIGIYRLTYHPKRGYYARFRSNGKNVLLRFPQFEGLMRMLNRKNGRLKNYVVQQGIRLVELESCPIDFRYHMTKDGNNQWVVAGIGAKQAGRGSVTTHIRTGGKLMTPEQALGAIFGKKAEDILLRSKEVAVQLAEAIERKYPRLLGELGFDIGVDQNEKIWMFEANAKPGRSIFKHPSLKPQGKALIGNILEHCLYLSKFRIRRDE